MLIPRFNNFRIVLPQNIIPAWLVPVWQDIMRDQGLAKVYVDNPINTLIESITGFAVPGMHMTLVKQTKPDANHSSYVNVYYPRGLNGMRTIDDEQIALTFRLIDGFTNWQMIKMAMNYMADDLAQSAQGEIYKSLDDFQFQYQLSDSYRQVDTYKSVVYDTIDGTEFQYNKGASEQQFTVRFKFSWYLTELYKNGECISRREYTSSVTKSNS